MPSKHIILLCCCLLKGKENMREYCFVLSFSSLTFCVLTLFSDEGPPVAGHRTQPPAQLSEPAQL